MRQLAVWVRQAQEQRIYCVLVGPRGRHWQDERLDLVITDLVVTAATYWLCAMDIKVANDRDSPSSVQLQVYATLEITPMRCRHPEDVEHT